MSSSTVRSPQAGRARFVQSGTGERVALTFHASGDAHLAEQMLDKLAALSAPVTIFAVGQWLEQHPSMVDRIRAGGHELANHTYTHPSLGTLAGPAVATEIVRCRDALVSLTGGPGAYFRPSGMDVPSDLVLEQASAAGYSTVVGYDVDPEDYRDPGAAAIVERIGRAVRPGSIVSLHLGHAGTVDAIDDVVAGLRGRGLQPVTVSSILA